MELTSEQKHRATLAAIMELEAQAQEWSRGYQTPYVEEGPEPGHAIVDGEIDLVAVVEAIGVVL